MIETLTEDNFVLYAAKHYDNPMCHTMDEFYEDLNRFKYLKRLFNRYRETGEIKERLVLNHIIILYNTFGTAATRMIFLKLDGYYDLVKPFLILLGFMPDVVNNIGAQNSTIRTADIPMNAHIVKILRSI